VAVTTAARTAASQDSCSVAATTVMRAPPVRTAALPCALSWQLC